VIIRRLRPVGLGIVVVAVAILGGAEFGAADDASPVATTPTGISSVRQEAIATSQEQTLDAIKRRALEILQERRQTKLQFYGEVSQGVGYEKNPLYGSARKGDWFFEDGLFLWWSRKLTPTITWQGSYVGDYLGYPKLTDANLTLSTVTPVKLLWQPTPMWRVDGGADLGYLWFPNEGSAGFREFKPTIGVRQNLWGHWFHAVRFDSSLRRYIAAHARDDAGNSKPAHRRDVRPRIRYEVGTTWRDTFLKVRHEWYWNNSNDQQQDFYDARDYKVTALVSRPITQRFSIEASYSYELKNYLHRAVSQVSPDRARHDDVDTWTLTGLYELNPTWSVSPSFTHTRNNSNEPTGEYVDWSTELTLTAHF